MLFVLIALFVLLTALLVLLGAIQPRPSTISRYELERRIQAGDETARVTLERRVLVGQMMRLLRIKSLVVAVLLFVVALYGFGWVLGSILTLLVVVFHQTMVGWPLTTHLAQRLYGRYESRLLKLTQAWSGVLRLRDGRTMRGGESSVRVHSREELAHVIDQAGTVLSPEEKQLLGHSLQFESYQVADIMVSRTDIETVDHDELLGPLVLDDLHKTGHTFFPVIDGDINHVVGILPLDDLVTLDKKRSLTAEKAMLPHVEYVNEVSSLRDCLSILLRTHQPLLIVTGKQQETVGMVTLEACVRVLFGSTLHL